MDISSDVIGWYVQDGGQLKRFLDYHLRSRISRRLLAEQHVAIHAQFNDATPDPDYVGLIHLKCDAGSSLHHACLLYVELMLNMLWILNCREGCSTHVSVRATHLSGTLWLCTINRIRSP